MQIQLPARQTFRQAGNHESGWSDHYGSLQAACAYAGLTLPARYFIKGVWQHGVFGPWQHFSPDVLVYNAPGARKGPMFVARQDQAELMRSHGYQQVRAIGMPILYVPDPELERIPGSLLVVPTHSLTGDNHADRSAFEGYAQSIKAVAPLFRKVTVCIHPNCQRNGLWVKEFTAPGIEIVYGAETNDANALLRMRMLFAQFESVTTNEWGSHVAYALAFGAKVSIAGRPIDGNPALHARDAMWKNESAAMAKAFSPEVAQARREFLQRLYVSPVEGVTDVEFGRWFVGADNRVPPGEMTKILGELLSPAPKTRSAGSGNTGRRMLFVSHEATRTGAPMFLLHLLRWLRANTELDFDLLLVRGGPLQEEFARVAAVYEPKDFVANPAQLRGYHLIYANTVCNASLLDELGCDGIPVITHVHELDTIYHCIGARAMAGTIRQSSRFVACAQAVATRMQQVFNLPADRFSVHYEMIDAPRIEASVNAADTAQLRRTYDLPENAFVVSACGAIDPHLRKGPDLFVQLAARLKRELGNGRPLRFLWVGAQPAPLLVSTLREDARKLGLGEELRFISELPSPHGLIGLSDLFCVTSREDPFPLVMLEAGLLGKPVLCFDGAGGAGEFCATGGGLSVPYLDVEAMAELAAALLLDPTRRAALGCQAAAVVRERFSVEAVAPALWREVQQHLANQLPLPPERNPDASWADIYRRWSAEAPQPAFVAAHLAREQARRQACRLVAENRPKEAVQLLVKTVSADLATKNVSIIFEGLVEIAYELSDLDPRQSAALLAKAREISASAGLKLPQLQPRPVVRAVA